MNGQSFGESLEGLTNYGFSNDSSNELLHDLSNNLSPELPHCRKDSFHEL